MPGPTTPRGLWGFLKRSSPVSLSGLTAMMRAPFCLAFSSAVSMRGWLVPGFCPMITISSASWTSSRVTDPLPMPITSARPTEVDSWHMLEQSGRLLVP